ncbi:MAG: MFS transporter [Patescibacteria group bacterium]|nr:MFS transporter [Patescibacteria group bacterium]
MNKVIKFLIASDFFLFASWGLLSPIFAIFILKNVNQDIAKAAEIAGFAALIYWITKSILQIPISRFLDRVHGEKDDYWFMILGLFVTGLVPFGFLVSSCAWHIYAFQVLSAIGMAFFYPSWCAIFTRHIDKNKAAFGWAMDSAFVGFGVGVTGGIGGVMASIWGFDAILIIVGAFSIFSAFILLLAHNHILPRDHAFPYYFPFGKSKDL